MKKQFLMPVLAVLFATGGAFASNHFIEGYYENSDVTCSTPIAQPCVPGDDDVCLNEDTGFQYRYKADISAPSNTCVLLERDENSKK
jgi:hypothetical protein